MFGIGKTAERLEARWNETEERILAAEKARAEAAETLSQKIDGLSAAEKARAEAAETLLQKIDGLSAAEKARAEAAEALSQKIDGLSAAANRHDMAIADMLDTWEEIQRGQREETDGLRAAREAALQRKAGEARSRETALLEAVTAYHDQLAALHRTAAEAGDAPWERQFSLAEEALSGARLLALVQVIEGTGCPVDYRFHEVVDTAEAPEETMAGTVAAVYRCGYAYRGKVVRRAEVQAFRATSREGEGDRRDWHEPCHRN